MMSLSTADVPTGFESTTGTKWFGQNRKIIQWQEKHSDNFGVVFPTDDTDNGLVTPKDPEHRGSTTIEVKKMETSSGITVALKIFGNKAPPSKTKNVDSLESEVEKIRSLHHFHIVEAVGSYRTPNTAAFLMRPWADFNLDQLLSSRHKNVIGAKFKKWGEKFDCDDIQRFVPTLMGCLAHALAFIHASRIKHKDIKPQNILIEGARVYLADFDISRSFKEGETSASVGIDGHALTPRYGAPEAMLSAAEQGVVGRSRAQDVYSLGCVFIEIFAFSKGFCPGDVINLFTDGGTYHRNMPKVLDWLTMRVSHRSDVQFLHLLEGMVRKEHKQRIWAQEAWQELVTIVSTTSNFCGACCMPQNPYTVGDRGDLPHPMVYNENPNPLTLFNRGRDMEFDVEYAQHEVPPCGWQRNLRVGDYYILDSVAVGGDDQHKCRKLFFRRAQNSPEDQISIMREREDIKQNALAEARVLSQLNHDHIAKVEITYRHGIETFAILTYPVARYDLLQYLAMTELKMSRQKDIGNLEDHGKVLLISSGCLASAVTHMHSEGVVHGQISPENILVNPNKKSKIWLVNFDLAALRQRDIDQRNSRFGKGKTEARFTQRNPYASPNLPDLRAAMPSDDIFSLGCVFVEMETVRQGRTIREMRKFVMEDRNSLEENHFLQAEYKNPEVCEKLAEWIDGLKCGDTYSILLKSMVHHEPEKRPSAKDVLRRVAEIRVSKTRRCGDYCVPQRKEGSGKNTADFESKPASRDKQGELDNNASKYKQRAPIIK